MSRPARPRLARHAGLPGRDGQRVALPVPLPWLAVPQRRPAGRSPVPPGRLRRRGRLSPLRALCDEEERARDQGTYRVAVSSGFHPRLAMASHNPAVSMIMESFREAILMSMRETHHEGSRGVEEHRGVVDAIERGDSQSNAEGRAWARTFTGRATTASRACRLAAGRAALAVRVPRIARRRGS